MKRSLSCISPDGRSTLTLFYNNNSFLSSENEGKAYIVVQFLPVTTSDAAASSSSSSAVSSTSREIPNDRQQQQRDEDAYGSAYTYSDNPDVPPRLALVAQINKERRRSNSNDSRRSYNITIPTYIVSLLDIDQPIGLVYCDSNSLLQYHVVDRAGSSKALTSSVLIALYSQSTVWILEIGCNNDGALDILSITEPFETYLLSLSSGSRIVRVRSAPRDVLAPAGSLAMLTSEGSLLLYHPGTRRPHHSVITAATRSSTVEARITTPVSMAPFLADDDEEAVTDFCFGLQNNCASFLDHNPSLGELSVLFLCQNGNVYGAAPVIFDSSAILNSITQARIQWMKSNVEAIKEKESATRATIGTDDEEEGALLRMYTASQHWMKENFCWDANKSFNDTKPYNAYSTAQLFQHGRISHSADWPLQIQGPLVEQVQLDDQNNDDIPPGEAVVIEPLPSHGTTPADIFVIGRKPSPSSSSIEIQLDVCILSTPVLPRFAFESIQDRDILDDYCMDGIVLDTVLYDFRCTNSAFRGEKIFLDIIVDPITPYMVHAANAYGVCTISFESIPTSVMQLTSGDPCKKDSSLSNLAWCCLCIDSETDISFDGVVVSEEAQFGHILLAHLSNNQVESIDVTASKYLSQVSRLAEEQGPKLSQGEEKLLMAAKFATKTLQSIPEFSPEVAPLIQKVSKGLSSMGRLVGSSTKPCDSDGTTVATLLECKTSLEENVVIPLKELYTATRSREKQLVVLHDVQKQQLEQLVSMASSVKEHMVLLQEKVAEISKKDEMLSHRAASILEASRGLVPKITDNELEYFTQLKRWEKQSESWEGQVNQLKASMENLKESRGESGSAADKFPFFSIQLSNSLQQMCLDLLAGQEVLLTDCKSRLDDLEGKAQRIINGKNST